MAHRGKLEKPLIIGDATYGYVSVGDPLIEAFKNAKDYPFVQYTNEKIVEGERVDLRQLENK